MSPDIAKCVLGGKTAPGREALAVQTDSSLEPLGAENSLLVLGCGERLNFSRD